MSQFPKTALGANPVFFRTYQRGEKATNVRETWEEICDRTLRGVNKHDVQSFPKGEVTEALLINLNEEVVQLRKYASELTRMDPRTEEIINPLMHYSNGIIFEPLEKKGGNLKRDDSKRTISLNLETVAHLAQRVPKELVSLALLVFLCHEVAHISQGIESYEDVRRMKGVGQSTWQGRMGELDLRSDFLAVNTLSLFHTLHPSNISSDRNRISWFYKIWCEVCGAMLDVFPGNERKYKQQRIFGYLLMSNLIRDAHITHRPLEFGAEMWPEWSNSLDWLSIYSETRPLVPGSPVDPKLMRRILTSISQADYHNAASGISQLWRQLQRR